MCSGCRGADRRGRTERRQAPDTSDGPSPSKAPSLDKEDRMGSMEELLDRQAIRDVVYRYCRGIDRLDMKLVRSCYHPDGIDHHTGFDGKRDDYVEWVRGGLGRMAGTMHM